LFIASTGQWLTYADARIQTSHDYNGDKAQAALALMAEFIVDTIALYQTLTEETWQ
jgi:hypothetical protein